MLYGIAILGAIIVGATMPLMTLIFGSSTSSFNNYAQGKASQSSFQNTINDLVLWFVYLFVGRIVIGYISTLCICVAAARTTNALRKAFFEALLRQGVSYFDIQDNGSPATQVTTSMYRFVIKLYRCAALT
jgi:ATP-binding cassette subfamily B (MDR/TAP) protein 1